MYTGLRSLGTLTGREAGLHSGDGVFLAGPSDSMAAAGLTGVDSASDQRSAPWVASAWDVLTRPLPFAGLVDRLVQRSVALLAVRQVRAVYGVENLRRAPQPFIVAVN